MSSREYPAFPIPCAAAIIMREGEVLLVQRGREPNYGEWSFPGGAIETGETASNCAVREAKEETGLEVEALEVAAVVDRIFPDESGRVLYHYLIVDYLARPTGGVLQPADDALQARWVPFEEAFSLPLAPPTGDVLKKAIRLWQNR
jgi:mutator protein MutT